MTNRISTSRVTTICGRLSLKLRETQLRATMMKKKKMKRKTQRMSKQVNLSNSSKGQSSRKNKTLTLIQAVTILNGRAQNQRLSKKE